MFKMGIEKNLTLFFWIYWKTNAHQWQMGHTFFLTKLL